MTPELEAKLEAQRERCRAINDAHEPEYWFMVTEWEAGAMLTGEVPFSVHQKVRSLLYRDVEPREEQPAPVKRGRKSKRAAA